MSDRSSADVQAGTQAGNLLLDIDDGQNLLDELRNETDVKIVVWRAPGTGRPRQVMLRDYEPSAYDWIALQMAIREEFGAGDYNIRARKGSRWIGSQRTVSIGDAGRVVPFPGTHQAPPPPASDIKTLMLEMQMANQQFMNQLLMTVMQKMPSGGGGAGSISDVIQAAQLMIPQQRSIFEQIKELREAQALLAGDEGDDQDGGGGAIESLVGAIVQKVMAAPAPTPAIAAAPAPQQIPVPRAAAPVVRAIPQLNALQKLLRLVMEGAKLDSDPGAYAVLALDRLGDAAHQLLDQPNALELLVSQVPEVAQHREWFGELIDEARKMLAEGQGVTEGQGSVHGEADDAQHRTADGPSLAGSSDPS